MSNQLFSEECRTIEEAKDLYEYDLFNPAAIFRTLDGRYVLGYIREMETPPHKTATAIQLANCYHMVAYTGPMVMVWHDYETPWEKIE